MDISVFLSHMRLKKPEEYTQDLYQEKLAEAILADKLGFDCIWVPEHHLIQFMQAPNGLVLAIHYGNHVSCPIGQMVNLLLYRHPLITAGEIALADALLRGRLQLGVGRGAYDYEYRRLGITWDVAEAKFLECLDVLEKVWRSPDRGIAHDGQFYKFDTTYVSPRPVSKPHPPVWYAAMTPPVIEFAAKRGYHVATWPFLRPMSFVEDIVAKFHAVRGQLGRARGEQRLAVMRPVYVAATEAEARKAVPTMLANHRLSQRIRAAGVEADERGYVAPDPVEGEPSLDQAFEVMIAGNPEQCMEKLNRYAELGVDQFIAWFDFGMEHQRNLETMQHFAEAVMVPFRREHGLSDRATHRTAAA
ncbi:MAG: flavin-dependent trigonelline monooxygenase, oxygenase component [Rhodospirillaceae bacterium]|jgi:alkanesulfonate monooxygenase SsuD/methylene tetrahydromethanopterin reductase-like flavin-dependent oxidoreductase (luciferase family)|nr:flavin-dependent trigonelline monooxygenase, oxygenase component [Rhodospirillaceae bacterium]